MSEGTPAATVADALRSAARDLAAASDTPRLDAELLMAHALGVTRSDLLLRHMRDPAPAALTPLVTRRLMHEPVAYIVGVQEFYGLPIRVVAGVTLIPRADSEILVDTALTARPGARSVLDLGTGSGCLLLAVLHGLPVARGLGIDRDEAALAVARDNTMRLGLGDRARFEVGDWTRGDAAGLPDAERFDLILANPPYVETGAGLAHSVRDFEPHGALFAGADGLDDYRVLVRQVPALLAPGGLALFEIGMTQGGAVTTIGRDAGLAGALHRDLGGRPRVIAFSHPGDAREQT